MPNGRATTHLARSFTATKSGMTYWRCYLANRSCESHNVLRRLQCTDVCCRRIGTRCKAKVMLPHHNAAQCPAEDLDFFRRAKNAVFDVGSVERHLGNDLYVRRERRHRVLIESYETSGRIQLPQCRSRLPSPHALQPIEPISIVFW